MPPWPPGDSNWTRSASWRRFPRDTPALSPGTRTASARRLLAAEARAGLGRARRVAGGPPRSRAAALRARPARAATALLPDLLAMAAGAAERPIGSARAGPPLRFSRPELPGTRSRRLGRRDGGIRGAQLPARPRDGAAPLRLLPAGRHGSAAPPERVGYRAVYRRLGAPRVPRRIHDRCHLRQAAG